MVVWYGLWSFGIFFSILVRLDQEKSGNPGCKGHFLLEEIFLQTIISSRHLFGSAKRQD
jgi:hypothetical protein